MEKLLTAWLYDYKSCPIPSVGTLLLQPGFAKILPGENSMKAPVPFIELSKKESSTYTLLNFIAAQKQITAPEAESLLQQFSDSLQQLKAYQELPLSAAGSFYMDANRSLHFKSVQLPVAYFPEVDAERVIHPDASHSMLVGDNHTNTTAMTEFLQEEIVVKSKWWIPAIILGLLGATVILFYYSSHPISQTGNLIPVNPVAASNSFITNDK